MVSVVARVVLWLFALVYAGVGIWGLASPYSLLDAIGFAPVGPGAIVETRATYGGLMFGIAIPLAASAVHAPWRGLGLLMSLTTFLGFGGSRLLAMLGSGDWAPLQVQLMTFEFVCVLVSAVLIGLDRPSSEPEAAPDPE